MSALLHGRPSRRDPWRVVVAEASMAPTIEPGDWLLVDPTVRRWPRRGSIVLFREPGSDLLVIKRVAGRPGDLVPIGPGARVPDARVPDARVPGTHDPAGGAIRLGPGEAWLLGDAPGSHDSRHYGPVTLDRLVARAWFRYGPLRRVGLLR